MSLPASVETPRPSAVEKDGKSDIIVPTTPGDIHNSTVQVISAHLGQAGHPQPPEKVAPDGEANVIMAKLEKKGIGAEAIELIDPLQKGINNIRGDIGGSTRTYGAEGKAGHGITMGRMARRVISSGTAQKIRHILFPRRK